MWIWILPVVISYFVFAFVAEHINPFKTLREVTANRRIKSGRVAGLIALISCYLILVGSHLIQQHQKAEAPDDSFSDSFE